MAQTEYFLHVTGPSERWDQIAARYYGNGALTHVLTRANRHLFAETIEPVPPVLPAGTKIIVPVLPVEAVDPNLLPPWKR